MTTNQRIAKINKSIELQKRIRKNVEACQVDGVSVDILDTQRMLDKVDEIIELLEGRISQIERRSEMAVSA